MTEEKFRYILSKHYILCKPVTREWDAARAYLTRAQRAYDKAVSAGVDLSGPQYKLDKAKKRYNEAAEAINTLQELALNGWALDSEDGGGVP